MTTKSCANCIHLSFWDYPATREEPGDSGWECRHEESAFWDDLTDGLTTAITPKETDEIMESIASQCTLYEYFDWEAQHKAEAESMAQYYAALQADGYL